MADNLPGDITRVADTADELLGIAISVMEEYGVEVPEYRFLGIGSEEMIAHDKCSQLTVSVATSRHGLPSPDTPTAMRVNTCTTGYIVDFVIQIVRCTASMNSSTDNVRMSNLKPTVSVDDIDSIARSRMVDVMVLHRIANAIADRGDQLGATKNYIVNVGPDSGQAQAISLIIPTSV